MKEVQHSVNKDSSRNGRRRISAWTYFRLILALLCVILAGVLVIQNAVSVRMRILFWDLELSMAVVLFFSVAVGVAIGISFCGWLLWKRQRRNNGGK